MSFYHLHSHNHLGLIHSSNTKHQFIFSVQKHSWDQLTYFIFVTYKITPSSNVMMRSYGKSPGWRCCWRWCCWCWRWMTSTAQLLDVELLLEVPLLTSTVVNVELNFDWPQVHSFVIALPLTLLGGGSVFRSTTCNDRQTITFNNNDRQLIKTKIVGLIHC